MPPIIDHKQFTATTIDPIIYNIQLIICIFITFNNLYKVIGPFN